ncbi:MAG TPA: DUF4383 domain-containing protein [Pseudonocardia sp.]|jgi:hypothetical protein
MGMLHPAVGRHPIHTVHRVSAGVLGVFLFTFGLLGLAQRPALFERHGPVVFGLSTNGLLAVISLVVGVILVAAAVRGGPTASNAGVVFGALFLLSGVVNLMLIGTSVNLLGFGLSNVVFSLVVGFVLLIFAAYGRITGHLPPDSPYYHAGTDEEPDHRTADERHRDDQADEELAEAERAVALHCATPEQRDGVRRAAAHRSVADRRAAWLAAAGHGQIGKGIRR